MQGPWPLAICGRYIDFRCKSGTSNAHPMHETLTMWKSKVQTYVDKFPVEHIQTSSFGEARTYGAQALSFFLLGSRVLLGSSICEFIRFVKLNLRYHSKTLPFF